MSARDGSNGTASVPPPPRRTITRQLRVHCWFGVATLVLFLGSFAVWSAMFPLQGAIATGGQFVIASEVKKIQHPSGGVVGELLVENGSRVKAGDLLLKLDETTLRANYQIIAKQLDEIAVRRTRLNAERDGEEAMRIAPELVGRGEDIDRMFASEVRLFELRRAAKEGRRAQLGKRVAQLHDEIRGLKAQQAAKEEERSIIVNELAGVSELFKRNLIQLTRLSALQRQASSVNGQLGQFIAQIAQSEGRIAETELQIIQLDEDQRSEVMRELREIEARENELVERRVAAADQLKRVNIRSPSSGVVHQLAIHTIGGVIQPGEPIMLIVPVGEDLQLEARVLPSDIDQISLGQSARIKIQAGQQSTNPDLRGKVVRVGADATRDDKIGLSYYIVRIEIPGSEIETLKDIKLISGMQAEVFIETTLRTTLQYLAKPITDHLDRVFRER